MANVAPQTIYGGYQGIGVKKPASAHKKTLVLGNATVVVRNAVGQIYPRG